ncbi:MAG: PAS domain-containing protein, partial [Fibrobacterota bacterium]
NALREREEQLRIVADMSLDMLSRHDLSGICTWASPACRQILHIEPDAVVGRSAFDFIYDEWHRPVQAALAKLVEIGRSSLEYRIRRSDGTGIWAETLWNLNRDAQGNPLEILCSTRDITDRKRQEEILKDSEYFFKESQRASSTGSYRLHLDTGFWDYSETLGNLLGIDGSFTNNVDGWLELVHPDDREMMISHFNIEVLGKKSDFNKEYRIVRPCDNKVCWVQGQGELVLDPVGNPLHMIGTIRDVTDRHKAEAEIKLLNENLEKKVEERTAELRTAMQELESFSYSISHDLRSPLRAIDGFSKALVEDAGPGLPEELLMYLGRIRAASQHMGQLIDDLLQLSRSSRVEIVRRDIDISTMATQILDDFCRQSPLRRLVRTVESSITIQGDSVLIRSVLENLLGNAWKYSSLKSESVIELSSELRDGRRWICIRDNGIGFDMAHADKLFCTFHRLHSLEQLEGTGICLATVRKIVERHGGSVTGSGIPEKGADFRFTLDPEKGVPS